MGPIVLLAFTSALNPTLIAVTTVMLLLPHPKRLMLGYLLGALMTSVTLGVVIVFALEDTASVNTTQHTVSPAVDIALGLIAIVVAVVLANARTGRALERRKDRKSGRPKKPPRWQRALDKGSARATFVIGALLTLPGASYLAALHAISRLHLHTVVVVVVVIAFNIVMLVLIEVPLLCFAFAPDWTPGALEQAKTWLSRHGLKLAVRGLAAIGALLVIKGVVGLLA